MWGYGLWGGFSWMWIFPLIFFIVFLVFIFRRGAPCVTRMKRMEKEQKARAKFSTGATHGARSTRLNTSGLKKIFHNSKESMQ